MVLLALSLAACGGIKMSNVKANQPLKQASLDRLKGMGSSPGDAMMIRIFKESSELEVWKKVADGSFKLYKSYEICAWSGALGPKVKEGDRQAPEGFYTITPGLMNPNSNYYLAFNTGFPNKFDRAFGRTGSELMVHGDCSSRGCYSMTDESIAEIYALARETFRGGNASFQLQIFPFRMTAKNLAKHSTDPSMSFWKDIKEGYDRFELARTPPIWDVCEKEYVFGVAGGQALEAAGACPPDAKVLTAALKAKQVADEAAMVQEVALLADQQAQAAAAAAKAAEEAAKVAAAKAAAKAQGEAIGGFIGGLLFGGGSEPAQGVIDPSIVPPIPAPHLDRG